MPRSRTYGWRWIGDAGTRRRPRRPARRASATIASRAVADPDRVPVEDVLPTDRARSGRPDRQVGEGRVVASGDRAAGGDPGTDPVEPDETDRRGDLGQVRKSKPRISAWSRRARPWSPVAAGSSRRAGRRSVVTSPPSTPRRGRTRHDPTSRPGGRGTSPRASRRRPRRPPARAGRRSRVIMSMSATSPYSGPGRSPGSGGDRRLDPGGVDQIRCPARCRRRPGSPRWTGSS